MKFLEVMGEYSGGLLRNYIVRDPSIERILEVYGWIEEDRRVGIEDEDFLEKKFIFAYDDINEECYIKMFEDGSNIIVDYSSERDCNDYLYENFEKMLFQAAFFRCEHRYFKVNLYFGPDKETIEKKKRKLSIDEVLTIVDKFAVQKKFKKVWFSDKYHFIAMKEDMTIFLEGRFASAGYIFGRDESSIRELADELNDLIGTEIRHINIDGNY